MDARSRRRLEMGSRALEFSRAHPEESPGYQTTVSRLEELLVRAKEVAAQQRSGLLAARTAAARKSELRDTMRKAHLGHLAQVAKMASREAPDLRRKFTFKPGTNTYTAFQTTARGFATEAEAQRELLVRHGLVEGVLADLSEALGQFDAAVARGADAKAVHVAATVELKALAAEVFLAVKVLDRFNRFRFRQSPEVLAAWNSVSSVAPERRPGQEETRVEPGTRGAPVDGGEVRPAA
ncbi:MAG TPA: hypothetical protein VEB59_16070 [Gemmatimonadales bacterium]|nr:hypothetical protein [Gemmatimonadales bacterium]